MPAAYAPPAGAGHRAAAGETYYQAFVGQGAGFDPIRGLRPDEFRDGWSNTILVATAAAPVPWTKPADIPFGPAADMTERVGFTPDACPVVMADGWLVELPRTVSPKVLAARITRDGAEVVDDE